MKKVAVLGSTGSIGTQALDVIRKYPDRLKVCSLVAFSNAEKLALQSAEFRPDYAALISKQGEKCLVKAVENCDVALIATRGIAALDAVLYCLENGIRVALANKEVLVCAGSIVMQKAAEGQIVPVDSEHSALWQCLRVNPTLRPDKLILTASGGPFWDIDAKDLGFVTPQQALKHPNWSMGQKITVDSATMMNKALEVVEAHWLFGVPADKIEISVHRQSIVHSLVQWQSGSVTAQLAVPDMKLPISLALLGEGYSCVQKLDFADMPALTFEKPDYEKFPCAKLGREILQYPPLCATIMNAANDACVQYFLEGKLPFTKFYDTIKSVVDVFCRESEDVPISTENIRTWDEKARDFARQYIEAL
ncbi:MAG: 1-deoxy-D-xylulose-5-phosphate reductoisomerase [Corallococcus sp.]|nr:1-deoxy-D-xylulose-5-phosphate reductoisomerase [Corallococcus sp.]MCM1359732.1 1-deoxy-D-xylulose-5-phosphate reductoisomerase [Corallococcus sp.]MCM1395441.1 1-deoxy-D-xylulose-5-phosphate reductoisomerase [Corallococcus sp.]